MSFIANEFGVTHSTGYYETSYDSIYGAGSSGNGVDYNNYMDFANQHFTTSAIGRDVNSIANFIVNGCEVIVNYDTGTTDSSGNKIYHAVVVDDMQAYSTGNSGGVIAGDPQNGNAIITIAAGDIESVVGITGTK